MEWSTFIPVSIPQGNAMPHSYLAFLLSMKKELSDIALRIGPRRSILAAE